MLCPFSPGTTHTSAAWPTPPLSAMSHDVNAQGMLAARLLLEVFDGNQPIDTVTPEPVFLQRGSTAAPPASPPAAATAQRESPRRIPITVQIVFFAIAIAIAAVAMTVSAPDHGGTYADAYWLVPVLALVSAATLGAGLWIARRPGGDLTLAIGIGALICCGTRNDVHPSIKHRSAARSI